MSKRFQINIIDYKVARAWKLAESLLAPDSVMMTELREKNDWKYNSGTGEKVYEQMLKENTPLRVFLNYPANKKTSSIGTYDPKTDALYLNGYALPHLSEAKLVAHLCHEYAHHQGFNHGTGLFRNYYNKDKGLYSVPYYITDNMDRWLGIEPKKKLVCKRTWKTLWLKKVCYETN